MFVIANVLQPLIDFFEWVLIALHGLGLGWGMAIVALTVIVRAALLPLTLKQTKGFHKLAQLQPEMAELKKKHKDDPQRQQQEIMKFYRANQVNPLASCLPLVAQLPVFFALFYMLQADLRQDICPERQVGRADPVACGETPASAFLFIPDLTDKATGGVLIALIVLYVGSQLLSTALMTNIQDRNQKILMYALPFIFVVFVWSFPAGLLVYWITSNLWTIVQQAVIRKMLGPMNPPKLDADTGEEAGPSPPERLSKVGAEAPAAVGAEAAFGSSAPRKPSGPPPQRRKKKRSGRRR